MKAKLVRRLLIIGGCVAGLFLAALPLLSAREDRPPAKTPDIQGTWDLVSWEKDGKAQEHKKVRFFITETKIYGDDMPFPDVVFKSHSYRLSPGDKPNIAIMNLSRLQGREMVPGLCGLEGATLRIVLGRVTQTHALPLHTV